MRSLRSVAPLRKSSRRWSRHLHRTGRFYHGDFAGRLRAAGYPFRWAGENLARGFPNPSAVVAAWMRSPGHRETMLDPRFRAIGVGIAGTTYTADFGARLAP